MLFSDRLNEVLPPDEVKTFFTRGLGMLMYSLLSMTGCRTYLEVGTGFGGTALMAGLGIKENVAKPIVLGIDRRGNRTARARALLDKYGIGHDIWEGDFRKYPHSPQVDAVFIDQGFRENQESIDRFAPLASKMVFVHDVQDDHNYVFPDGFTVFYIRSQKAAVAFRQAI